MQLHTADGAQVDAANPLPVAMPPITLGAVTIQKIERVKGFETETPLAANGVYTSPTIDVINYKVYTLFGTTDQAGSYLLQHSDDGITWYSQSATPVAVAANGIIATTTGALLLRYFRLVYTNGATLQTIFRLTMYLSPL